MVFAAHRRFLAASLVNKPAGGLPWKISGRSIWICSTAGQGRQINMVRKHVICLMKGGRSGPVRTARHGRDADL